MPINTAELALQALANENTSRIQRQLDDAARVATNDPIRQNIGPNGFPKSGIYHGTALIREIGGEPIEGSGFEEENYAEADGF